MTEQIKEWRERVSAGYEERDEREARDAEIAELRAALEAMRKDAERYRWLRDGGLCAMNYKDRGAGPEFASGDDFDAEVDIKKSVA